MTMYSGGLQRSGLIKGLELAKGQPSLVNHILHADETLVVVHLRYFQPVREALRDARADVSAFHRCHDRLPGPL